jgi:NADH-quinone oxidoreductase subunit J
MLTDKIYTALIFWGLSGLILGLSFLTIILPRITYSLVAFVAAMFVGSGIFFLLGADFVGVSQILIYGIGVAILFVFGIMLTSERLDKKLWLNFKPRSLLIFGSLGLFFLLILHGIFYKIKDFKIIELQKGILEILKTNGTVNAIGNFMLSKYVLPFELMSILLLVPIIGIAFILKGKNRNGENTND